jgi:hypothetical protein
VVARAGTSATVEGAANDFRVSRHYRVALFFLFRVAVAKETAKIPLRDDGVDDHRVVAPLRVQSQSVRRDAVAGGRARGDVRDGRRRRKRTSRDLRRDLRRRRRSRSRGFRDGAQESGPREFQQTGVPRAAVHHPTVFVPSAQTPQIRERAGRERLHRRSERGLVDARDPPPPTLIAHVGVGGHRGRRDGALDVREEPGEQIVDVHEPEERAAVSVDQRRTVCARFR